MTPGARAGQRRGRLGLRQQLMALSAGTVLAAVAVLGLGMANEQTELARRSLADQASAVARSVALGAEDHVLEGRLDLVEALLLRTAEFPGVRAAWVLDPSGTPQAQVVHDGTNGRAHARYAKPGDKLVVPAQPTAGLDDATGSDHLSAWHPIMAGNLVGWVRVDLGTASLQSIRSAIWRQTLLISALAMAASLLLLSRLLRGPMQAVRRAADFAVDLEHANGRTLPDSGGAREVRDLVGALNHASAQLHAQRQAIDDQLARLHRQEAELADRNEQLALLVNLSPEGIASFDAAGQTRFANPALARMLQLPLDELARLSEQGLDALLQTRCGDPGDWLPLAQLFSADASAGQGPRQISLNGPPRLELALQGVTSQAASARRLLFVRDITRESELDRLKTEFLATAAHELRTPMTSIYGFAELLADHDFPPEQQKHMLGVMYRNSAWMCSVLDELLDLSRLEARRGLDFDLQHADLQAVVRAAVNDFAPPAGRQPPLLDTGAAACLARIDSAKIGQVLRNLLSNAYKYSPVGSPVRLTWLACGNEVGVAVTDQGIGMTAEQLARVCERFYRADASGAVLGTGLGMSIVQLHGGRLLMHSQPGQGTTVQVWLPAVAATVPPKTSAKLATEADAQLA